MFFFLQENVKQYFDFEGLQDGFLDASVISCNAKLLTSVTLIHRQLTLANNSDH